MLTTTVPSGIKLGVFVRIDNVVIKLQDNCEVLKKKPFETRSLVSYMYHIENE